MKKNIVRGLALALVLVLALGIIPLGVFAIDPDIQIGVDDVVYSTNSPLAYAKPGDIVDIIGSTNYQVGQTIKVNNYSKHYLDESTGEFYDFQGFSSTFSTLNKQVNEYIIKNGLDLTNPDDRDKADAYWESLAKKTSVTFSKNDIKIDPLPVEPDVTKYDLGTESGLNAYNKALEAYEKASTEWFYKYSSLIAGYTPHQHSLSYWYSDSTTHWRECLVCRDVLGHYGQFMFQNWHSDGDEDRVCDVCYADIPYHEISIEEVKGGKITVDFEEAPHRRKITANVEPEEGYKLKKIHFIKVRTDGSEQEITRRKTSSKNTWWAYMPTYDLKVTAEFVKK